MSYLKTYCILFLPFSFIQQGFTQVDLNGLALQQTAVNDKIIKNSTSLELAKKNGSLSKESAQLINDNELLKKSIEQNLADQRENSNSCQSFEKPKKIKTITKTKETGGWTVKVLAKGSSQTLETEYSAARTTASVGNAYNQMVNASNYDEIKSILTAETQGMSVEEQINFASGIIGKLPYGDDRAAFKQSANQGSITLMDQLKIQKGLWSGDISGDAGGVCGDIHFAGIEILKAVNPNLEGYTVSYATQGSQHMVALVVDPSNPDRAYVMNYSTVQVSDGLNGVDSIAITTSETSGSFNKVMSNMRVFKDVNGKPEHVATFKTQVGSLLYQMSHSEHELGATPIYEDQRRINSVGFEKETLKTKEKTVTKFDKDGKATKKTKTKSKLIANGVKFFESELIDGTQVFGLAVYNKRFTNLNSDGTHKDPNKFGFERATTGTMAAVRSNNIGANDDTYILQIAHRQYVYSPILQKDNFYLKGKAGYQLSTELGLMTTENFTGLQGGQPVYDEQTALSTGDADLTLVTEAELGYISDDSKTHVAVKTTVDKSIGLKDQRNIYNISEVGQNLKFTTNAVRVMSSVNHQISPKQYIGGSARYTGTNLGGQYALQVNYQNGIHNVFVNFQDRTSGISNNALDLLPNNTRLLQTGYNTSIPFRNNRMQIGGSVGYDLNQKSPVIQGGIKLNIGGNKNKKKKKIKTRTRY